jgi:hypothetical protein
MPTPGSSSSLDDFKVPPHLKAKVAKIEESFSNVVATHQGRGVTQLQKDAEIKTILLQ